MNNRDIFSMNFSILHVTGSMRTLLCWSVALITKVVGICILATVVVTIHYNTTKIRNICKEKQDFFITNLKCKWSDKRLT
jgi:hypothetical protein